MSSMNCEDLSEFAKIKGNNLDSYLNRNSQIPVLTEELYKNSTENLQDELTRIEKMIRLFLEKPRAETVEKSPDFADLFISESEANAIVHSVCYFSSDCEEQKLKSNEIEALERTISKKKAESLKKGIELRLHSLSVLFSLKPFETDVLLIALAPELDGRFAKLYAYLCKMI